MLDRAVEPAVAGGMLRCLTSGRSGPAAGESKALDVSEGHNAPLQIVRICTRRFAVAQRRRGWCTHPQSGSAGSPVRRLVRGSPASPRRRSYRQVHYRRVDGKVKDFL